MEDKMTGDIRGRDYICPTCGRIVHAEPERVKAILFVQDTAPDYVPQCDECLAKTTMKFNSNKLEDF